VEGIEVQGTEVGIEVQGTEGGTEEREVEAKRRLGATIERLTP
ncbi:16244_t:CDS:1, partial [Funneliformis geosporum]